MFLLFVLLSIVSFLVTDGTRLPQSRLHHFMDDEELRFYFGSENVLPDYEIVELPEGLSSGRESVIDGESGDDREEKNVNFQVFNKDIKLNLHPNKHLISPYAKFVKKMANGSSMIVNNDGKDSTNCHYLHVEKLITAAISNCISREIHGLILMANETLEILPLNQRLKFVLNRKDGISLDSKKIGMGIATVPHLIKRSPVFKGNFENDFIESKFYDRKFPQVKQMIKQRGVVYHQPTVELGLFFDESFNKFFAPFFEHDNKKMQNFILSYINGVQSLYLHHSLGRKVDFTIAYLELMEEQSPDMPHAYGERNALIDNFCQYQKSMNPLDDRDPGHWDMAVYVSALDFFAWTSNGNKNGVTMGLATVGGVCNDDYNCIIAEFGSINQFGKPYPSSGYVAVYILAHEIGHNLGMSHDSTGNSCPKDGFIMSPSRGTQGETTWSPCSATVIRKLDWAKCLYDKPSELNSDIDPWKFSGYPGISYTEKDQCEILLRDREAFAYINGHLSSICDNLHCRSPSKPGFFFAGPALTGTTCGYDKWCEGGKCVNRKTITTTSIPTKPTWGHWNTSSCMSQCIKFGKGYQTKRRTCSSSDDSCEGSSFSIKLCDDSYMCSKRKSVTDYGTEKCEEFSQKLDIVDSSSLGLQASYDNLRLWMPCAIFCKRKNTNSYFTPRAELHELGLNPYFPDGTLCHREGKENFFCIQNHCLPESTTLTRSPLIPDVNEK